MNIIVIKQEQTFKFTSKVTYRIFFYSYDEITQRVFDY